MTKFLSWIAFIRKGKAQLGSSHQRISSKHKVYQAQIPLARWCSREEMRKINVTLSIVDSQFLVSNQWWVRWFSLGSNLVVSSRCSLWWWEAWTTKWGCTPTSLCILVVKIPSKCLAFLTKTKEIQWPVVAMEQCHSSSTSSRLRSNIIPLTYEAESCVISSILSMQ